MELWEKEKTCCNRIWAKWTDYISSVHLNSSNIHVVHRNKPQLPTPEGRPVLLNPKSLSHLSEAIGLKINPHIYPTLSLGLRSLLT